MHKPLNSMRIRPLQFGAMNPVSNTFGKVRRNKSGVHQGWDLSASPGTPVFAVGSGKLTSGTSQSYGKWLQLEFTYQGRTYYAFYAHLLGGIPFNPNHKVGEGDLIGFTGRSGNASALPLGEAHLHFELRTVPSPPGKLSGRLDPGEIFGYRIYSCSQ